MELDWDSIAAYIGYETKYHMFHDLYEERGLSIAQIARRVGASNITVAKQLKRCGVEKRTQGGANTQPKKHYFLHCLDQRYIFQNTLARIASHMNMSIGYVHKYKKLVKGVNDGIRADLSSINDVPSFED